MKIKRFEELYESTMNYYPGLSDDGSSDHLADIMKKIYKNYNSELRKKLKVIENYGHDERQTFYNKWMMANMITTSLQQGFYIEEDLIDTAKELYEEVLSDKKLLEYTTENDNDVESRFKKEVEKTFEELKKETKLSKSDYYYSPHFMKDKKIKNVL